MGGVDIPFKRANDMRAHIKPPYVEKNISFYDFWKNYNPTADSLQKLLNLMPWDKDYVDDNELLEVSVMLNPSYLPFINFRALETKFSGSVSAKYENGTITYMLNDKKTSPNELKSFFAKDMENTKRVQESKTKLLKKVASLLTLHNKRINTLTRFSKNKMLFNAMNKGEQILNLKLTKKEIISFVKENKSLLLYVSKKKSIMPLIHKQAQNSHVDPIAFNAYNAQGQNIDILYTEHYCPDPSWFNNTRYTIIDNTGTGSGLDYDHTRVDGDIIRYGANQAHIYCGSFYNSDSTHFNNAPENIDVESYSWGISESEVDNEYDSLSASLDNHIYTSRNTVCVSAGNIVENYANTKYVNSPGKALNAITVGAIHRNNHTIFDFSAWDNADTMNEKPEVVAVGEVWDEHLGGGQVGTSQAAPHVAAIAANYMSRLGDDWNHRAIGIKALIMASATEVIGERDNISDDANDKSVGVGGVQFTLYKWRIWEMFDDSSNSFTRTFYVPQGAIDAGKSLRVVLTWLNKGDYTIAHKGHDKISIDLDLKVEDPNGRFEAYSNSYDNPYEVVSFTPKIAGNYTITVYTYAYRDKSSYKKMGMAAVLY